MRIREADSDDITGIARVHVDTWRTTYRGIVPDAHLNGLSYERSENNWRRFFAEQDARAFVLVVEDGAGRIVGFANGGPEREGDPIYRGEVGGIYLLAECQRRGVGRALMAEAARRLLAHGFKTLLIWLLAQNPACGFYAALGGRPVKEKSYIIGGAELVVAGYGWDDIRPLAALKGLSMSPQSIPLHDDIPVRYTWNAPSVFSTAEAWEVELKKIAADLPQLKRFAGHLADSPATLADALDAFETLLRRAGKVLVYASMAQAVDTTDQVAIRMYGQAWTLFTQVQAAMAFLDPELIAIGEPALRKWIAAEPRLAHLTHYADNLFRKQAHIRSAEVEELLGMLADPFGNAGATMSMLTDADFKFRPTAGGDGRAQELTQGTLMGLLASADRETRRTAWENYHDLYVAHKNTLASNLATSIKQNVFQMRARRHNSTLEASLFEQNVPVEVFHNLLAVFWANLPTWHRYFAVRRRALGVATLQPYDLWAPLTTEIPAIPYEQAVEMICAGLAPMGEEYVATVRQGCLADRWVDVYPCRGKAAGAFSSGWPGTHPFIMISYNANAFSLSTLAHELGHSVHSLLAWQTQPMIYCDYSLFVAEVASNFHQALVRAYLLEHNADPAFQISLIEEAMANFYRYFFIMPTLARFELAIHEREERGEGLTADGMMHLMADLFAEGFGEGVQVDRDRVGIIWATFGHLYQDYYVYQYATGIAGAHALARRILDGAPGAVEAYLGFLKTGNSVYPLDALHRAGVDLTTPAPVEAAFAVLAGLVERLEGLVA